MYDWNIGILISLQTQYNHQYLDAVEMKGRKWILQTFQYEEKTISQHYTQTRNIEKGGE